MVSRHYDYTRLGIAVVLAALLGQVLVSKAGAWDEGESEKVTTGQVCGADNGNCLGATVEEDSYAPKYATVRLTYYVLRGRTFSGEGVHYGGTACSWNFSIGQRFKFKTGDVVTCNDRGLLGSAGWLDVWNRPDLTKTFGNYATVEVLP